MPCEHTHSVPRSSQGDKFSCALVSVIPVLDTWLGGLIGDVGDWRLVGERVGYLIGTEFGFLGDGDAISLTETTLLWILGVEDPIGVFVVTTFGGTATTASWIAFDSLSLSP